MTSDELVIAKGKYLLRFAETARNDLASQAAKCGVETSFRWRRNDKEFAIAYEQARKDSVRVLEDHAIKRGTEGVSKPIYQRGQLVGFEQQYSDGLLQFILKGQDPETYRERISLTGKGDEPIKAVHGMTKEATNLFRASVLGIKLEDDS